MPQTEDNNGVLSNDSNPPVEESSHMIIVCAFSNCSEQITVRCRKCNRPFCIMHANRFSPNFCKECFANLAVMEGKFVRTFEDYDTKNEKLVITKESCTKYQMDGPDWPFLTAYIDTLSDDELKAVWNFHFFVMKLIESENETRKIERARKIRETPLPVRIITQKTVTKVAKQVDTKEDIIKRLQKQGLPQNVIDMMVSAMK